MTTQTPYQPTSPPPPDPYPTAPPWAPAAGPVDAEPAGVGQPGWEGVPYTPHGQLMVKYPQALRDSSRPKAPAVWPVVIFTLVFGLFGVISATRRAGRAGQSRNPKAPYWIAFGATLVSCTIAWSLLTAVAVPVYLDYRQTAVNKTLAEHVVRDGKIKTPKGTTVASAKCEPTGATVSPGVSAYTCVLTLSNGRSATVKVASTDQGVWAVRK